MTTVIVTPVPPPIVTIQPDGVTLVLSSLGVEVISIGMQGPVGATGPSGTATAPINFSFGDASPAIISTGQPAQVVLQISVKVLTAFNGVGATLAIGTVASPNLFVSTSQIDLATVAEFEIAVGRQIAAGTNIIATITPGAGATAGNGWIVINRVSA